MAPSCASAANAFCLALSCRSPARRLRSSITARSLVCSKSSILAMESEARWTSALYKRKRSSLMALGWVKPTLKTATTFSSTLIGRCAKDLMPSSKIAERISGRKSSGFKSGSMMGCPVASTLPMRPSPLANLMTSNVFFSKSKTHTWDETCLLFIPRQDKTAVCVQHSN